MNLNYVLLPEDYLPSSSPPPADTANDDDMDVDEVPMGEPMEVDVVEVRPKRRVIRVTVDVVRVVPTGEPMEVDPVPAQPCPVLPRPSWNVDAADHAPAQPWPVLPRPAWNIDMADFAKFSRALIVGGTRVSRRSPRKPSPSKTIAPQRPAPSNLKTAKPVISAHPHVDMSKIATSSKVKVEDMSLLFVGAETSPGSLNVAHHVKGKGKEPEVRIRKTKFSSPLSPVKQSKIDDNFFITSNRQSPELITNNRWLKISRTPGRNIHNESVFEGCNDADHSQLAASYPPTHDGDTLFPEIKRFSPVRRARMDDDFFLRSNRQTPDLAVNNRWLKISRTPDHNIYNEPTTVQDDEDDGADYSSLCMGYPPSDDTEDSLPEIDFAEADTSLNWAPGILTPETPHRIRRTKLFSPLSPIRQSKLDEDDLFTTSKRQTPDIVTNNGWLKTSRTPGHNIHNESVFCDNEYADYSYLALAYPFVDDSDTSLDEGYTSNSLVSCTSGYLADDSFSFIETSYSSSSSLASNDSFDYLADVSCCSFADISEVSNASRMSMADDQMSYPSCETVSEAASQTDLSCSASMDLLIATMSNLVINEDSDMEDEIADESPADNERTISEDSFIWRTAEETAPRDAGNGMTESSEEERLEATQSDHEGSTEDSFDSHYPSSLSSSNESSCSCSSYIFSSYVNLSGVNLSVSSGRARSTTETELLEDVGSLAVDDFRWEYDEPEAHEGEEEEDHSGNGNQLIVELAADAQVDDEDKGLVARHNLFEHGTETELDVSQLEDDLKYIYTLPY